MHDRVFDPAQVHKLEAKERLLWLPPGEVLGWLELRPGMIVADIGTGTGYFAIPMARAIAPGGRVFAVDLQAELLDVLRGKLGQADAPANIVLLQGTASSTGLADASCDLALLANVWHELDDHAAALAELERMLKPAGRIAVLDWRPDAEHPPGPPIEHRLPASEVQGFFHDHGKRVDAVHNVGQYSYLILAS
jgi:ubiquinone/menaquinone biosynthesis C-methylase UbiE